MRQPWNRIIDELGLPPDLKKPIPASHWTGNGIPGDVSWTAEAGGRSGVWGSPPPPPPRGGGGALLEGPRCARSTRKGGRVLQTNAQLKKAMGECLGQLAPWEVFATWTFSRPARRPPKNGLRGGQRRYSNLAIRTALTLRVVFGLPLRQTEGFLDSLLSLMSRDLKAPDHTTLSRRNQIVVVPPLTRAHDGPIDLIVDSTGLKILGCGEWNAHKHKASKKRRDWRKLHIGVDAKGFIVAAELTASSRDDASTLPALLDTIEVPIRRFTADEAYDHRSVYDRASAAGTENVVVVIPSRRSALWCPEREVGKNAPTRAAVESCNSASCTRSVGSPRVRLALHRTVHAGLPVAAGRPRCPGADRDASSGGAVSAVRLSPDSDFPKTRRAHDEHGPDPLPLAPGEVAGASVPAAAPGRPEPAPPGARHCGQSRLVTLHPAVNTPSRGIAALQAERLQSLFSIITTCQSRPEPRLRRVPRSGRR